MKNVLFVCSQNRLRSPTAERIFHGHPKMLVESAGIDSDSENPLTPELLDWAEFIFVMEESHREKLLRRFRANVNDQQIVCLGIRDKYDFMAPALIRILRARLRPFLRTW